MPSFELRRDAEATLREYGPASIVLRPPFFMENLASPWIARATVSEHTVPYPLPEQLRVSWLTVADLGGYVAAALRRPDLSGRVLDIGGPEMLDGQGLARRLSPAFGHSLRYVGVPSEALERALTAEFGSALARGIARTYSWLAEQSDTAFLGEHGPELISDLSRPLTSLAEWARSQLGLTR